jgi:hypothetical protein
MLVLVSESIGSRSLPKPEIEKSPGDKTHTKAHIDNGFFAEPRIWGIENRGGIIPRDDVDMAFWRVIRSTEMAVEPARTSPGSRGELIQEESFCETMDGR